MKKILFIFLIVIVFENINAQNGSSIYKTSLHFAKIKPSLDGRLNDLCWQEADSLDGLIEYLPNEGKTPEVRTIFYFTYDEENLYIGFKCYEKDSSLIRSTIGKKDSPIYNDDYVQITFWPAGNPQVEYNIYLNSKNVRADSYQNQSNIDFDWQSSVKISSAYWSGEILFPLKNLRFIEGDKQEWKYLVRRSYPRNDLKTFTYPKISLNNSSFFNQAGSLLIDDKLTLNIKRYLVTPYVVSSQTGKRENDKFKNDDITGKFGIDRFEYLFTQNDVLTLAIRPDFSTAEIDAPVIDVNQKYSINYPEKRAFFFDGFDIFQHTAPNIFYSRTLNNPLFIGKYTGKISNFKVGFINAYDENSPFILPFEETSIKVNSNKKSLSNIFRTRYDYDENYFGAIITNRNLEDGYNIVYGLDGFYKFDAQNMISFSWLRSTTKEIKDSSLVSQNVNFAGHSSIFDGEKFSGNNSFFEYQHSSRNLLFVFDYNDISPEFRSDNGFINHNDFRSIFLWLKPKFYFENDYLRNISVEGALTSEWNYGGIKKYNEYYSAINFNFALQTRLTFSYSSNFERFDNTDYNKWGLYISISNSALKFLNISSNYSYRREINYSSADDPLGYARSLSLYLRIIPIPVLNFQINYNFYNLMASDKTTNIYKGETVLTQITCQLFTNFGIRTIIQRNTFQKKINLSFLFSYEPSAFTGVYVGFYSKINEIPTIVNNYNNFYIKMKYTF